MLSFINRTIVVGALVSGFNIAIADPEPPVCDTHANSVCPAPAEQYGYIAYECPGAKSRKCTEDLPQAIVSCEQSDYGETYCEAWPQAITQSLHYAWHSSNPSVNLDGADSPLQFLSCAPSAYTTISVTVSDTHGRTTSAEVLTRCKIVNPGNQNNHLTP